MKLRLFFFCLLTATALAAERSDFVETPSDVDHGPDRPRNASDIEDHLFTGPFLKWNPPKEFIFADLNFSATEQLAPRRQYLTLSNNLQPKRGQPVLTIHGLWKKELDTHANGLDTIDYFENARTAFESGGSCLIHPLPALAFVAGVLLAIAVGIYGVSHKDSIVSVNDAQHEMVGSISYSFYLACGALAACIADIVVGILTVTLAQSCL
ncbi:hypothetical protein QR680_010347 [Steinernema hermaphroditum]|uniref:Uncharacterized protein n=1 Tax=Steinernema hermaphroditum TaxID=289476 RepID=A0AA39INN6_9BILA|nr:hypothetical protein QR680_010347 [Steinernema hermaphroditum]